MSQTSASEPPIMAKTVAVLDNTAEQTILQQLNQREDHGGRVLSRTTQQLRGLTTSTVSETSDYSSSVLWTPQTLPKVSKKTKTRRCERKRQGRRLWNEGDMENGGETTPFLTTQSQQTYSTKPAEECSFERDYERVRKSTHGSRRSQRHKKRQDLNNDHVKYHHRHHRRSHRNKHRKHNSLHNHKDETVNNVKSGLPRIIQRIKDFFLGKKPEKRKQHTTRDTKEHHGLVHGNSRHGKNNRRQVSERLFRSASDSDIEVVKHLHRRQHGNDSRVKDDLCKDGRHWKTKRIRNENKLSSICESSEKLRGLDRGSGSDGRLVLAKNGSTMYNDINFNTGHKNNKSQKKNGVKMEKDTSDDSRSQELSKTKEKRRRRCKDYQSLKRKWAKQHQSFENDLEKLEKLVKSINMKKPLSWSEQQPLEDTTLLQRLEAKQEKCVAEVDFTRHVLVCKLQRLENKLEESLSLADSNNNNTEEREKNIEEIRQEMSKECRDLRKLLQETSDQLKQVLEEKPSVQNDTMNEKNDQRNKEETQQERLSEEKCSSNKRDTSEIDVLKRNPNIPFPELSHHPLNVLHTAGSHILASCVMNEHYNNDQKYQHNHIVATCVSEDTSNKQYTRVSTYV